jgi:ribonuclease Z
MSNQINQRGINVCKGSSELIDLQITFLGTGGSIPTLQRGLSAIMVRRKNESMLFDCGEGTQRQMIHAKVGFHKLTKVFVTHMHGDHVLGLPGLLQTMSLLGRTKDLKIFGPIGIKKFIDSFNQTVSYNLTFRLIVSEIEFGIVCKEKEYTVTAVQSGHMNPSLSYALTEKPRPGRFYTKKARSLGVPEGELWSKLQNYKSVKLDDGRIIEPQMVLGKSRPGRKIVYTGDAGPSEALVKFAKKADLLIHEATFEDELKEKAIENGHSTPSIAAKTAKNAEVKKLILTHISARYRDANLLLQQAKHIFAETELAKDFLNLELPLSKD